MEKKEGNEYEDGEIPQNNNYGMIGRGMYNSFQQNDYNVKDVPEFKPK